MKKMSRAKQPGGTDFFSSIPDEVAAIAYMQSARWPNGVTCIHCNHSDVWTIRGGKLYTCKSCRKQFTVRTGTVMESSHIKVQLWIFAVCLMTFSRKSISSVQLAKQLGITQKSAWLMAHRIRESCKTTGMFAGSVEGDETYTSAKAKNMHRDKRIQSQIGTGGKGNEAMFGIKSRGGKVRAHVVGVNGSTILHESMKKNVAKDSTRDTDEHKGHENLNGDFNHSVVRRSAKRYFVGNCHTNGIEPFWALRKRANMGTFHHWSKKHLFRYVNEFVFKQNTNGLPAFFTDGTDLGVTTVKAHMAGMIGRRLMYKTLTANA